MQLKVCSLIKGCWSLCHVGGSGLHASRQLGVACFLVPCPIFLSFRKLGVPYLGVLFFRILLSRLLYWGPLFSELPYFQDDGQVARVHRQLQVHSFVPQAVGLCSYPSCSVGSDKYSFISKSICLRFLPGPSGHRVKP